MVSRFILLTVIIDWSLIASKSLVTPYLYWLRRILTDGI